jgi:hypothetical protein
VVTIREAARFSDSHPRLWGAHAYRSFHYVWPSGGIEFEGDPLPEPKRVRVDWDDIGDLDLDPDNPRHEPGMPRREIIQYLVQHESVLGLAKDIAEVGLSPLDLFGALEDPEGGYEVVEGNRRLCALILLHDPSLAPTKERKAFERLSRDFDPIDFSVELTIFDDRDEANKWIERKHSGQAGGIGPRSWTATQQARHYGEKTGNQLALALLEYAIQQKMITKAESQSERGVITTVTRFVGTPYVRQHGLGIVTTAVTAEFKFQGTQSLFDRRLRQLMTDIVNRTNGATSRANSTARVTYAQLHLDTIVEAGPGTSAPGEDEDEDENGKDGSGAGGSTGNDDDENGRHGGEGEGGESAGTNTAGKPVHPNNRALLVPDTFNPSFRDEQLKRILSELKLAPKKMPLSAALIVRVFLESITVTYLETRKGKVLTRGDKLHLLVHAVLTDIEANKKAGTVNLSKTEASALELLKSQVSSTAWVYSAAYLGMVAHGTAFPEWSTLTSKWDEVQPIFLYIAVNAEPPIVAADPAGQG